MQGVAEYGGLTKGLCSFENHVYEVVVCTEIRALPSGVVGVLVDGQRHAGAVPALRAWSWGFVGLVQGSAKMCCMRCRSFTVSCEKMLNLADSRTSAM